MASRVDQLKERNEEIRSELQDLESEFAGEAFDEAARAKWNDLNAELEGNDKLVEELEARAARINALGSSDRNTEKEPAGAHFHTRKASTVPDDPTDLEGYSRNATSMEDYNRALTDGAMKIVDQRYRTAVAGVSREEAQGDAETLLRQVEDREVALRFITTSTDKYRREFAEYCRTGAVGPELMRTASLTNTAGGYAVPVELDTTLLLTNAGAVNPIRDIARVRQTNVNTVEFINTAGVTAAYGAEASEASDNAPVLAQPVLNIEMAKAFVPMSIQISQDWANIQQDLAMCFADAKNRLESTKFLKGLGHSSNEPQGLIAAGGATAVVSTATTAVFAVGDLMSLEIALAPRYRPNATIVGNRATFQKVRQFASNGVNIWTQLPGNSVQPQLIGYPVREWSDYDATPTTSNSTILTIGDFSYFAIVDRAGMNVEFIPHLFGSGNRYPTGQRGLFAYWRNSSQVLSPTLSANSAFQSLKVL